MRQFMFVWLLTSFILTVTSAMASAESLTLQEAVDIALGRNPGVLAAGHDVDASKAAERGARALANPELWVAPTAAGTAGSDSAVLLVQPLEINGQRTIRTKIATYEAGATKAVQGIVARDLILGVKQAYWDVVQAADLASLNRDNVSIAETLHEAALRRRDVGASPGAQVIKSEVELARARQELSFAESRLAQAKARLNTLMGRPAETAFEAADPLEFVPVSADILVLRTTAESCRPEMAEAQASLMAREAKIKAVEIRRRPDVVLQARQEAFDAEAGVAVGVVTPLLDWGSVSADAERARDEASAQSRRLESVRNAVLLDVELALSEVNRTESLIGEYQKGVVSQAEQLAKMAQKGFDAGANSYLEVLEAQRTLKAVRTEYSTALADHLKAVAQLEWATGACVTGSEATK